MPASTLTQIVQGTSILRIFHILYMCICRGVYINITLILTYTPYMHTYKHADERT
jgi:hypothetical protein